MKDKRILCFSLRKPIRYFKGLGQGELPGPLTPHLVGLVSDILGTKSQEIWAFSKE